MRSAAPRQRFRSMDMKRAIRSLGVVLVLTAATGLRSDVAAASAGRTAWNVLLITLDTTRADRLGAYGFAAAATPNIDRLAREGVLFEQAESAAPLTLP